MISETRRLEVLIDGVSQGYVHLRLNGDLKVTKVSRQLSRINSTCLMVIGVPYMGFDFKSYETTLEKGLRKKYQDNKVKVKESPLPKKAERLYRRSLSITGRL